MNVFLAVMLLSMYAHVALSIAVTVGAWANALVLFRLVISDIVTFQEFVLMTRLRQTLLACLGMCVLLVFAQRVLIVDLSQAKSIQCFVLITKIGLGVLTYQVLLRLQGMDLLTIVALRTR